MNVKLLRWTVQGAGALIVAGLAAYLLIPRASAVTPARPAAAALSRVAPWSHAPSSRSSGWVREQWIMQNQPAWMLREWRAASCPPVHVNTEFYYFGAGRHYGNSNLVLNMPPASREPPWWDSPIPPTGFPDPGQRGC